MLMDKWSRRHGFWRRFRCSRTRRVWPLCNLWNCSLLHEISSSTLNRGGRGAIEKRRFYVSRVAESLVAKMYPLHLHSEMFWCILWRPFLLSANAPCLNIESGSRREGSGAALQTRRRCRDWTKISIFALAVGAETGPKLVFSRSP